MSLLHDFINNCAILVFLVFAYSRLFKYLYSHLLYRQLINGALFGIISLAVMAFPVHFQPGIIFDTRTIVLSACGLFCGPTGALVAVVIALAYRIPLGGAGVAAAISSITSSALIGVGYHYLRKRYAKAMEPPFVYIFGLVVHVVMILCFFLLPFDLSMQAYRTIGPYVITIFPIASLIVILLLHQVEHEFMLEFKLAGQNAELEKRKSEYEMLFQNMSLAFASHTMLYDNDGKPCDYRFLRINPAFETLTGLSADKLIGRTVKEVLPGTEDYWIERFGKVAATGEPDSFQNYSGELGRFYNVTAFSPAKDEFAAVFSDITEQRQAESRRDLSHKVSTLLNSKEMGEDVVVRLGELFKEFSGADGVGIRLRKGDRFPYSVAINLPENIAPGYDAASCEPLLPTGGDGKTSTRACLTGMVIAGKIDRGLKNVTRHGSFWTNCWSEDSSEIGAMYDFPERCALSTTESFALIPITKDDEAVGLIKFLFGKPNKLSLDFVEFFESLAQSIAIAIARVEDFERLEQSRREAEAASRAKSEFLSMMSHELRTPLSGIVGFGGLIDECLRQSGEFEQKAEITEHLEIVRDCGNTLTEIINDILVLSSIEAGQNTETATIAFNPAHLIEECLNIFKFKVKAKNLYLRFHPENLPGTVIGPAKILKQILFNLVGNAVKFTRHGGVDLTASCRQNVLRITVKDTGIGMPPAIRAKMLEPFTQADQSSTRRYGGTGLGLTIVARSLEKLGQRLDIAGDVDKGTVISFSLPVELPPSTAFAPSSEPEKASSDIKSKNILVVEDSQVSLLYLETILKGAETNYALSQSFAEMKTVCEQGFIPDVALIDISLPDADGFDCLKWLRQRFPEKHIRCVAQTAHVLKEHTKRYQEAGFDAIIGKPFRRNELLEIITTTMG